MKSVIEKYFGLLKGKEVKGRHFSKKIFNLNFERIELVKYHSLKMKEILFMVEKSILQERLIHSFSIYQRDST